MVQLGPCVTDGLAMYVVSAFTRGSAIDNSKDSGGTPVPPINGPFTITAAYPEDIGQVLKMPDHQYSVMTHDYDGNGGLQFFIVVRGAKVEVVGRAAWVF